MENKKIKIGYIYHIINYVYFFNSNFNITVKLYFLSLDFFLMTYRFCFNQI